MDKAAIKDCLVPFVMYVYIRYDYIGPIKRSNYTLKEQFRSTYRSVPDKRFTKLMVRTSIAVIVYVLNYVLPKNGISDTMSPEMIIEGRPKLEFSKKKVAFGAYILAYINSSSYKGLVYL